MKSDNPPIKHHYIPAFYLKRWGNPDGRLIEYSKHGVKLHKKTVHPDRTGYEERLYEIKGLEPEIAQHTEEHFFKQVDDLASKSLSLLEKYGEVADWNSKTRTAWSRFVVSLLLRCPEDIDTFRERWNKDYTLTNQAIEEKYKKIWFEGKPNTFSELLENSPESMKESHLFEILCDLIDNQHILSKINSMTWLTLEITADVPKLLTSDRPVFRTNGLIKRGDHIALPLSPNLLFIASHDNEFLRLIKQADIRKIAKAVNQNTVESAVRFVYSHDTSQNRFISNRFGQTRQIRLMEDMSRIRNAQRILK